MTWTWVSPSGRNYQQNADGSVTWHYVKVCHHCGRDFETRWAAAKFCSGKCRMAAHRAKTRVTEIKRYCKWCGSPFYAKRGNGEYCCNAHKQAAYRARKGAGKQGMF